MNTDLLTELMAVAEKHGYRVTDYTIEDNKRIEIGMNKEKKNERYKQSSISR